SQTSRVSLASNFGCRFTGLLAVSCEGRHNSDQPLDDCQLWPMVHFMLLGSLQHFEAGFGQTPRVGPLLGEDCFGEGFHPLAPALAFTAQQLDNLALRSWTLLLHLGLLDERSEIVALER